MAAFPVEPAPKTTPVVIAVAVDLEAVDPEAVNPEMGARRRDRHVLQSLFPGILLLLLLPVGASFLALKQLLGLPDMPRCWAIAQARDSTSNQIYCAEILASKQTVEDLSGAIQLVRTIQPTDPLHKKAEHLIQQWTTAILTLANIKYQAGSLSEAQDIAQQVPSNVFTANLAAEQIKRWEAEWAKAEDIYTQTQTHIDEERWYDALTSARQLLQTDNRYWATQKYQELMRTLQSARENNNSAKKATTQNQPTTVDDLITRWEKEQQQSDAAHIQQANALAKTGDLDGLRAAITEAEQVLYGTPQYEAAQQLTSRLRQQAETLEDRPRLQRAIALASRGDLNSLEAAIDEASQVTWGRALYEEARDRADTWRNQAHQLRVQAQEEQLQTITGQSSWTDPLPPAAPSSVPLTIPSTAPLSPSPPLATDDDPIPRGSSNDSRQSP